MKSQFVAWVALLAAMVAASAGIRAADTNWYSHGGTHDESNYSALDQINTHTIGRLGLAWSLDLTGEASLEATPLAIDGSCTSPAAPLMCMRWTRLLGGCCGSSILRCGSTGRSI